MLSNVYRKSGIFQTAVAFLGLALIISITNGYDRKFTAKAEGFGEASMEMNKKVRA